MRGIKDVSLKYKLPFLYSATLIVLCVSFYLIIFSFLETEMRLVIENELEMTTNQIYSMIKVSADSSVRNELRSIVRLNKDYVKQNYNAFLKGDVTEAKAKEQALEFLMSQQIGTSGYVYILNSEGVVLHHPSLDLIGSDLSEYDFVKQQMELTDKYIQYDWKNPEETQTREKALYTSYFEAWDWVISASSYRAEFDELIQVEDFEDELYALKFGDTGYSFVMQGDGKSIVHPFSKGENLQTLGAGSGESLYEEIIRLKNGVVTYWWTNSDTEIPREKIAVIKYFPEYDWYLASSGYKEELFKPISNIERILIAGFAFMLLFGILVALIISRTIYTPVHELSEKVKQGAGGDLSIHVNWDRQDELGDLGATFNTFIDRLKSYRDTTDVLIKEKEEALHQVHELNDNLEVLVEERTKALNDSVSELQSTRNQLTQTEKLSTAGQVVTGIAHRLNTPLGTAITMSSFLSKEVKQTLQTYEKGSVTKEDLYSMVQSIDTGLKMMEKNLIKSAELIEVMKSVAGMGKKRDASELIVKEVLNECLDLFPSYRNSEKYMVHIACDTDLVMITSRAALTQVLQNLISNAYKHGFAGKENGSINISIHEYDEELTILFSDDGVGITEDLMEDLFSPFSKFDTIAKGAGLGLYIVHSAVVNGLKGSIKCDSSIGHGTRFEIKIPKQNI